MLDLDPATLISRIFVLVIAFTVHEFAHAWTANSFGDNTPSMNGRLTLNPLAHLDPIGSLMLLVAGFGWAKPVPINPYALQRRAPSAVMWVSLAGPFSNLLMAILAAIPFKLGLATLTLHSETFLPSFSKLMSEFIFINLILMLFNLIPLPPLDGDKILDYFAPPPMARFLDTIRPYGPMLLLLIVFALPLVGIDLIGWIIYPILSPLLLLLTG